MINTIFTFLKGLKMTAQDYLIAAVVAIVGALVAALKIQGFRLHRAQVLLLKNQIDAKEAAQADITQKAYDAYKDALGSYLKAGGVLILMIALLLSPTQSRAASESPEALVQCPYALSMCNRLQSAQQAQIKGLQDDLGKLEKQAVAQGDTDVALSTVSGGVGGGLAGLIMLATKGLLIGGLVGGLVGLGIGLLVGGGL